MNRQGSLATLVSDGREVFPASLLLGALLLCAIGIDGGIDRVADLSLGALAAVVVPLAVAMVDLEVVSAASQAL